MSLKYNKRLDIQISDLVAMKQNYKFNQFAQKEYKFRDVYPDKWLGRGRMLSKGF